MTLPDTAETTAPAPEKPPERRLAERLGVLSRRAEKHEPPALRAFAQLRRAKDGRFGTAGPADATLLDLLRPMPVRSTAEASAAVQSLLDDAMLVAWLVATARPAVGPGWGDRPSFGGDFRLVRRERDTDAAEHLMNRLLASSRAEIARPLRRAVPLLASTSDRAGRQGRVDVEALVRDLGEWDREDRAVQRRWAYDFWFIPPKAAAAAPGGAGQPTDTSTTSTTDDRR